jgi:hypothetical protein
MSRVLGILEKVEYAFVRGQNFRVLVNPTRGELEAYGRAVDAIRLIKDYQGNWYVWNAMLGIHSEVAAELGLLGNSWAIYNGMSEMIEVRVNDLVQFGYDLDAWAVGASKIILVGNRDLPDNVRYYP